jgi:adenine-specific DNA-methyltransferase
MKLILNEIYKALNKAYLKQDLFHEQIAILKTNLKLLLDKSNIAENKNEYEEHFKNLVSEFLKETFYRNKYEININKRKDLVIHNGKSSSNSIGIIIEAKRPSNHTEMISINNPNCKALHELILYYFEERNKNNNVEVKHLIANNIYEWFVFDENEFDLVFYRNTKLQKLYKAKNEQGKDNPFFYVESQKILNEFEADISCTYFNLKDYKNEIADTIIPDDSNLINLYKILSPEHLLKIPFANDSNSLNKDFYNELLHIVGLEERPDGGKKLISRKKIENRDDASLLENTINKLNVDNCISNFENVEQFGETEEEQLYSIALELCITWLNRILFLKLLEGQLCIYHNGDTKYNFLNANTIPDFDALNELFFEVLAVDNKNRTKAVNDLFGNIPYLNSSLFEKSEIEIKAFPISNIKSRLDLFLYPKSILRNKTENKVLTRKNTLHYLFDFLSAFNFSSDSSAKIQENNKTIINASVLGLIFEKINGYKDGSFFTPGFITMYMCQEAIRNAVTQKFIELENKEITNFKDVKNYCTRFFKDDDICRFNSHIDSIKICDPAVGSGHFLVSALNEIIAIKSELNILVNDSGTPLEYDITVENDELIILCKKTNKPFKYLLGANKKPPKILQQVQVTLFKEKQKIIENCLFGVDINPKSVLICRLRLWIELLKNAYYKPANYTELETLPNIDINIKCGNTLISRFNINDNHSTLPPVTQQKIKLATEKYKQQVIIYKSTIEKAVKKHAEKEILRLKGQFSQIVNPNDNDYKYLKDKRDELGIIPLFFNQKEQDAWKIKIEELANEVAGLELAYNNKQKTLYGNALEWRFEFPEVLDVNGNFIGFDLIIGNPPYVDNRGYNKDILNYYFDRFKNSFTKSGTGSSKTTKLNLISPFFEIGFLLLKKSGVLELIFHKNILKTNAYSGIRKHILHQCKIISINDWGAGQFEDVIAETASMVLEKGTKVNNSIKINIYNKSKLIKTNFHSQKDFINSYDYIFSLDVSQSDKAILSKIETVKNAEKLQSLVAINNGIVTGDDKKYLSKVKTNKSFKPAVRGRDIKRYCKITPKMFVNYDKEKLLRARDENIFMAPEKLIMQMINTEFIVTYDENQIYNLGTTYAITPLCNVSLKYIIAILNSKLFAFYYKKKFINESTLTNAISTKNLYEIPILRSKPFELKLIKVVDALCAAPTVNETLTTQIDELIYKAYDISPAEQETINSFIN